MSNTQSASLFAVVVVGGAIVLIGFFVWLWLVSLKRRNAAVDDDRKRLDELKPPIASDPASRAIHGELLVIAKRHSQFSQAVYNAALFAVEQSKGEPSTKQFALAAGRLLASFQREKRAATVYDEHAIQNDIAARCPR